MLLLVHDATVSQMHMPVFMNISLAYAVNLISYKSD